MESGFTLDELIKPVTAKHFFVDYWETSYLHLQRGDSRVFQHLFSLDDLDKWLASARNEESNSVLVTSPEGAESGAKSYRPREITIDKLYEAFSKGHSIVLNQLESSWPPLFPLVKGLGSLFCGDIGVNLYLTPRGSRAFPVHTDGHDVFVLQVHGEKVWRLHELRDLTMMHLQYVKELVYPPSWTKTRTETPLLAELVLKAGDILYIPRGMPHCAVARDETSLHLTLSVVPLYWMDFVKAAVEQAYFRVPALRKALPADFLGNRDQHEAMRRQFRDLVQALSDNLFFDDTLEVITRNRVFNQGYPPDGHFSHLARLSDLSTESFLARREGILCAVESEGDFSCIRFGLRSVRGPVRLRQAFEFIRDHPGFKVSKIPGLDDQSRLVITRRLIREGLLRFSVAHDKTEKQRIPSPATG
jgi:ribosomal protein L16 Arg81 hydroxylase